MKYFFVLEIKMQGQWFFLVLFCFLFLQGRCNSKWLHLLCPILLGVYISHETHMYVDNAKTVKSKLQNFSHIGFSVTISIFLTYSSYAAKEDLQIMPLTSSHKSHGQNCSAKICIIFFKSVLLPAERKTLFPISSFFLQQLTFNLMSSS